MKSPNDDRIAAKHGAGGRAMRGLIEGLFLAGVSPAGSKTARIDGVGPLAMDDGAAIRVGERYLVMTTDSHVVHPIFFPGGDIGRLAVSGTVNDLAMMGATEVVGLTCGVIIEEGFYRRDLERVVASMGQASQEARAPILTGDTKVMGHGELDGLVINTAGVGFTDRVISDAGLGPGDRIILTGSIGDHGLAVMAARNKLEIESTLRSDVAPIGGLVAAALATAGDDIVAMKDPTRGGLASALHEMASKAGVGVVLDEQQVPLTDAVKAASELLGIDPMHVANEGKAIIGVRGKSADCLLEALRAHPLGREAAMIGRAQQEHPGKVILETGFGRRLLSELEGEPLPRIC